MKRSFILIGLMISFAAGVACSTVPISATSTLTPLEGKTVAENLGKTKGTDSAFSVLGLYMIGRPDIDLAMKEALAAKQADTLINVRLYQRWSYFLLFDYTTVIVEGDAVKFAPEKGAKGGAK